MMIRMEVLHDANAALEARWPGFAPRAGLILGSGWSPLAESFEVEDALSFEDVPGLGRVGVAGHAGRILRATAHGVPALIFQGRRHWYEGEGWTPVAIPAYLLAVRKVQAVLITNAAGGMRTGMQPGDLMAISDHINLFGSSPLIGPAVPVWGPRFPDMTHVYDPALRETLVEAGTEAGVPVSQGVYLGASGPAYETPAEIRAWGALGADAVGMSTVPEAMLCHAAGIRVAGLSCISNLAAGLGGMLHHQEVTDTAKAALPRLIQVVQGFWRRMPA